MNFGNGSQINLTPQVTIEQHQKLGMNQIFSLNLLTLPCLSLTQEINQKIETNPFLRKKEIGPTIDDLKDWEERLNNNDNQFNQNKQDYIMNSLTSSSLTLEDDLLEQAQEILEISEDDEEFQICEKIIENINHENGRLDDNFNIQQIADELNIPQNEILQILLELQNKLTPAGVLARSYQEYLLLQIKRLPLSKEQKIATQILDNFKTINQLTPQEIAKKLKITVAQAQTSLKFIQNNIQNSFVNDFEKIIDNVIIPELYFYQVENDKWICEIINNNSIEINQEEIENCKNIKDKESQAFYKKQKEEANLFIQSLSLRESLLKKLGEELIHYQNNFFNTFGDFTVIQPIKMKDFAEKLNIATSTLSRAIKGKYAKIKTKNTKDKIFAIKDLFCYSSLNKNIYYIKKRIKELLNLDKQELVKLLTIYGMKISNRKISDQQISDLLSKEGIKIARRTVAKYKSQE